MTEEELAQVAHKVLRRLPPAHPLPLRRRMVRVSVKQAERVKQAEW
jgi:hypothetical protein